MSWKDIFIEKVEPETTLNAYEEPVSYDEDVVTEGVTQENLIEDVYSANELSDKTRSVFKIEELVNTLPKEMPTATKRTTVLSMLSVFGLNISVIADDGFKREEILNGALNQIVTENKSEIAKNNTEIENKKLEIADLEAKNGELDSIINDSNAKITSEIDRIKKIINFITGE